MTIHTTTAIVRKDPENHTFTVDTESMTARTTDRLATDVPTDVTERVHRETTAALKSQYGDGSFPVRHRDVKPGVVVGEVTWEADSPAETMSVTLRGPELAWLRHSRVDTLTA